MINKLINRPTLRQRKIFEFVAIFSRDHGFPPSIREIGGNFHIAPSSVSDHLKALERKGFIHRIPFKPRCLGILKKSAPKNDQ
ncbi:MAG: hypothetical protein AUJ72_01100 [Candidatus Omnitrophica bacterium CG1_02_46_14]|nr:MAG: hypothetical protein AUJ72_01100 [Candidatus Omnitrophica bacterium CG1_02_46_14]